MANLHDCLQRAVDAGELDTIRADQAKSEYDQLVERYIQAMPRHQAEATAATHLKEATSRARRSRRHAVVNQLQAMVRIQRLVQTAPDPALAIRNLIEQSEGSGYTGESVQSLANAYIRSVNAGLNDVLRETGRNLIGNSKDAAKLRDVVRELHGEATGNTRASWLADAVRHQQKRLRQMFNAHGGDIGQIADYGLAHSHDVARLRKAGYDAWAAEIAPRLDWNRMIDLRTGQPFAAKGARPDPKRETEFLRDVYRGITTRGWDTRDVSMAPGGKALYNRRADPRVLHFANGTEWLGYNAAFGTADPFSSMIGQLHGMARDVALMRVLGPNPKAGLELAQQVATKQANQRGDFDAETRIATQAALAKAMLAHVDGSANNTASEGWARFFANTRKVLTSIQLGSAAMSAVTDAQTITSAAQAVGMNGRNVLARSASLMASSATRATAARMGYVADTLANAGATAARFTGDVAAGEIAERLTGVTMRASGLAFWTDMNKTAFQMEFAGFLADNADRAFAQIDAPLRTIFEQRGISAADWDLLRDNATLFRGPRGETFLTPMYWLERQTTLTRAEAEGLAMRLQMAIEEQLEYAVPTANVEGRARMLGTSEPGTFAGELLRSSLMYKSFGLSLTINQIRRFMTQPTPWTKFTYAAKMAMGLTVLGAVAVQLKELVKGNDPRPMDDGKFWMAAVFQGGGLGIFGDFFASETSRAGGGLAETLAGPVAGFASDVIGPVASNAARAVQGDDTMFGRDLANLVRYNTPVASSLWYERLAFDRLVADQLHSFLDPDAEHQWRRQMRRRERDYGTSSWWQRGAVAPDRAPDLTNIAGGQQ